MIKKWKLLESKPVFESHFISLFREKLERPDGKIVADYYSIKRRDVVYIVALTKLGQLPLVYQYKNGVKTLIWELPAGFVDEGETSDKAAQRELLEETGFVVKDLVSVGNFTANAGSGGNRNHFYLGLGAEQIGEQSLDENEEIEVKLFDFNGLVSQIRTRTSPLVDSQSCLALLLAWEEINKNKQ